MWRDRDHINDNNGRNNNINDNNGSNDNTNNNSDNDDDSDHNTPTDNNDDDDNDSCEWGRLWWLHSLTVWVVSIGPRGIV